ncbi:MAG: flagellar export protein FliJ [Pseudomonadota bacterium]|nr:flagellar export protein FliJ [Pseudomonadota bacterium]
MRSQRLDPLLRVKQQRQDDVARTVAERDRAVLEQEQRLDALRQYAAEYAAPEATIGSTFAPALLANRLAFREKLDSAVEQQKRIVDTTREHADVERTRLLLASRETHVLEQLRSSYRAEESRHAEKHVQRELDDIGARRMRNVLLGGGDTGAGS